MYPKLISLSMGARTHIHDELCDNIDAMCPNMATVGITNNMPSEFRWDQCTVNPMTNHCIIKMSSVVQPIESVYHKKTTTNNGATASNSSSSSRSGREKNSSSHSEKKQSRNTTSNDNSVASNWSLWCNSTSIWSRLPLPPPSSSSPGTLMDAYIMAMPQYYQWKYTSIQHQYIISTRVCLRYYIIHYSP